MNTVASLPAKWREDKVDDAHSTSMWDQGFAYARNECADELEAALASPAPSVSPAYDRELIVRMLFDYANLAGGRYDARSVREQAQLISEADNASGEAVTVNRSSGGEAQTAERETQIERLVSLANEVWMRQVPRGDIERRVAEILATPEQPSEDYKQGWMAGSSDTIALMTEQPGSAVLVGWCALNNGGTDLAYFDGKPMVMPGKVGNEHHPVPLYAGTPPAPAAEQGCPICTGECVHTGSWIGDVFKPLPPEEVAALKSVSAPGFAQPEARGVEMDALDRSELAKLLVASCVDLNAESAEVTLRGMTDAGEEIGDWRVTVYKITTPNPVRAEQPEQCGFCGRPGKHDIDEDCPALNEPARFGLAEQPEGKGANWLAERIAKWQETYPDSESSWVNKSDAAVEILEEYGDLICRLAAAPAAPGAAVGVDAEWFADVRRCLQDVSTEMRARGRGDERFQRLIQRMPAALAGKDGA